MLPLLVLLSAHAATPLEEAVKPRGMGGVSRGKVVVLEEDTPVYRMWDGPDVDAATITNELGQWWTFTPPSGTVEQYRKKYAICTGWNDLLWISVCTLKAGATVVVGPTQSVSEETCEREGEHYRRRWTQQVYIQRAWQRDDLVCEIKYRANPEDLESR